MLTQQWSIYPEGRGTLLLQIILKASGSFSICSRTKNILHHNTTWDTHSLCFDCIGHVCGPDNRCDECRDWTPDQAALYARHQEGLAVKRRSKQRLEASPHSHSSQSVSSHSLGREGQLSVERQSIASGRSDRASQERTPAGISWFRVYRI